MHPTTDAHWNEGVIAKLPKWAADKVAVRAVILTSNRAGAPGSYDALSDFDVVLVFEMSLSSRPSLDRRLWCRSG